MSTGFHLKAIGRTGPKNTWIISKTQDFINLINSVVKNSFYSFFHAAILTITVRNFNKVVNKMSQIYQ